MTRITNSEFADKTGCSPSLASRIRAGERIPSRVLWDRIVEAFGLDEEQAFRVYVTGSDKSITRYLLTHVFMKESDDEE